MDIANKKLSVVIPCYNEEAVITETYNRLKNVMKVANCRHELIFVNDGSADNTMHLLRGIAKNDTNVIAIDLSRNFGHQIAVSAGINEATGDAVVLIDADLQDPPELILEFLDKWKEGYSVVYAIRNKRDGETWFKKITARIFYRFLHKVTDISIPMDTGDFRLMDRKVVDVLKRLNEKHRFIRGLVSWVGFKQVGIYYDRAERFAGESKYPLKRMIKFSLDGITSFSFFPLRLATFSGMFSALLGVLGILVALYLRLGTDITLPGWTSLMIVVLFLGGMQLFILGILGEYIGRIYDETRNRPLYVINEKIGIGEDREWQIVKEEAKELKQMEGSR